MPITSTGFVVWFTGLPASGKSTLADILVTRLAARGRPAKVLDGDAIRAAQHRHLGFSMQDRMENVRRVALMAAELSASGHIALCALISPLRAHRDAARQACGSERFLEVYLSADASSCEARDPKGNYRRARAGEIKNFTGVSDTYEVPEHPDLVVDSAHLSVDESIARIEECLTAKGWLP